ncbi:MAG: pyridoxal kinase [Pseudomonadota bacterium]
MNILSLSSRVAYGHVGHAASVFCLQRLGHEVWPVDTALLSNHLGYPTWGGRQLAADEVAVVLEGLERMGVFAQADVFMTGFLGKAPRLAVETLAKLRGLRPDLLYALDPVMGERKGGLYVPAKTAALIKEHLLGDADITFPNLFELDTLSGNRVETLQDAIAACETIRAQGRPDLVVVATGIERVDGHPEAIETMAVGPQGAFLAATRRRALKAHGAGDCFAALFLGHYLNSGRDLENALGQAASAMAAVVEATGDALELALIRAQDAFAKPPKKATLERLR